MVPTTQYYSVLNLKDTAVPRNIPENIEIVNSKPFFSRFLFLIFICVISIDCFDKYLHEKHITEKSRVLQLKSVFKIHEFLAHNRSLKLLLPEQNQRTFWMEWMMSLLNTHKHYVEYYITIAVE